MKSASAAKAIYKYIVIRKLRFDPNNPRFFGTVAHARKTQNELYKELIDRFGALGLVDSILSNGFMPYEPLVVRKDGTNFVVVEGNRRLASVKYILAHGADYSKYKVVINGLRKLPCIIFEEGGKVAKLREQTYLGLRHFSGYKPWQPKSKAEYLVRQIEDGVSPSELAVKLNTTSSKLKKYLIATSLLKKIAKTKAESPSENLGKFWLLAEALQRSTIQEYLDLEIEKETFQVKSFDKANFANLCRFLYGTDHFSSDDQEPELEPVISDTRQISKLAEVLASPEARIALEKHNDLSIALAYVHKGPDILRQLHLEVVGAAKAFLAQKPTNNQKDKLKAAVNRILKVN